jgi:2-isopropylmalate synthase
MEGSASHAHPCGEKGLKHLHHQGSFSSVLNTNNHPIKLQIYDTTLRDGTQGVGISFSLMDKIRVAERLAAFGVDYIEGGWPGSNPKDMAFFGEAKKLDFGKCKIAAFGSTRRAGVAASADPQIAQLLEADTPVVTIFGKSWKLQVEKVLAVPHEENLSMIRDSVSYLKARGREVFYDAEHFFDGYKDDAEFALSTLRAAAEAGADALVLCDTNGGTMPKEIAAITAVVNSYFPGKVGIHSHNDCGMAAANAMAAVEAGAVQIQGTINGYGERTGNCNLTTLIPCLQLKEGIPVVPDLSRIRELSLFVDELANCSPDIRAPFVGSTAFAHKGGMHVNAVAKIAASYEHIPPSLVGNSQNIMVSELAGRSNVLLKAEQFGLTLEKNNPAVLRVLEKVKMLESEGFEFESADASLELLIRRELGLHVPLFSLKGFHCDFRHDASGATTDCQASVTVLDGEREIHSKAGGHGPVDALDAALRKAFSKLHPWIEGISLTDYKVRIVDSDRGTAARTRVHILSAEGGETWGTVGVSHNIIEASWMALVDSLEFRASRRLLQPSQ